jgi:crotonobetainyl-CoA:carnitine CoA-transferase CaiB-like acyl-CoA transferase
VPCGPIQDIAAVFEDPQVQARNMKIELEHPAIGPVPGIANPIKFSKTRQAYQKAPPLLGEDTAAVLNRVLGKSDDDIKALRDKGVI